jgi:hypothetical protein
LAGALAAATPGLPFTETFDDATLADASHTSADWGVTTAGKLTLPMAVSLVDPITAMSTGVDLPGDPQITRALALADMNGDGFLDIVQGVSGVSGVFLNDGAGHFTARSPITSDSANTRGLDVGDVNDDGFLDVVAGNLDNAPSRLYLNSGDGVTFVGYDISPSPFAADSIVLADFDGDGDLDVAVALNGAYRQPVFLNTGDPSAPFGASGVAGQNVSDQAWNAQEVLAGDLNNDGTIDLAYMNQNAVNTWCLNDGAAHFACHGMGAEADNSQSGALGDVNGDGYLDVIVGNYGTPSSPQSVRVYFNSTDPADPFGGATPLDITAVNDPTSVHRVDVADMDDDGDLDILLATSGNTSPTDAAPTTNRVLLNDGTGQSWTMVPIGGDADVSVAIAAGDVDADGKPDIVVGNEARDAQNRAQPLVDRVYLNTGNPSSTPAVEQLAARAASLRVDSATSNIAGISLTIDPAALGPHNRADFWVSSNGGANWLHIDPGRTARAFPAAMQGQDLRWRADLSSLSPATAKTLAIEAVSLAADGPAFTSTPVTDAKAGTPYEYDVTASDPQGDKPILTAPRLPAWLTFTDRGDGTGTLAGAPGDADVADHAVQLVATDAGGAATAQDFTITVAAADAGETQNSAPSFTSAPVTTATAGTPYSYAITAIDPDAGDTLTLSAASTLPAWLALTDKGDGTGTLAGTPTAADVGEVSVDLEVKDSAGATATQNVKISVSAAAGGGGSPTPPPASSGGGGGGSVVAELAFLLALTVLRFVRSRRSGES